MADISRIDLYLQQNVGERYVNTKQEQELVTKFQELYCMAKAARDHNELASPTNVSKWRKAYYGTLNALNKNTGDESERKSRSLRKMLFEMVESKIDNQVPMPKMTPRYKTDLPLVQKTEDYLKFEIDRTFTKFINDRSERATYVDGTSWYKVWWDSLDNTHERSGTVKIDICLVDQIVPQPGVLDYRKMEYIFEEQQVSLSRIYDLYGRLITPAAVDTSKASDPNEPVDMSTITMITCYYLNSERIVGRFAWAKNSLQVICNEDSWQIRKLRTCTKCGTVVPQEKICPTCGSTRFKYENATVEILEKPIMEIYNPYEVGETDDETEKDKYEAREFLPAGTEIPFYQVRQLPFVPRPAVSSIDSLYGVSEGFILLEMQDSINKMLTKAEDKVLKSGTILTKPEKMKVANTDNTIKILGVRTAEEAAMVNSKPVVADTTQDITFAQMLYDISKATTGVTSSFQGQRDTTAVSGKAKQIAAVQSAGRIESLRVMKAAAFAGVYDLALKYLLAFSDETRKFTKTLPDGTTKEESWNKYMFLDKDKYGNVYYRDDFSFNSDPAATLSQDRVSMWQETQDKFIAGAFGNPSDPRVLLLFWNILSQLQYPLANIVIAGITENNQHLPAEVEQMLMQNPQILQNVLAQLQAGQTQQGGARPNSGPAGNGATHAANVEKTNIKNRGLNKETPTAAQDQINSSTVGGDNESIG